MAMTVKRRFVAQAATIGGRWPDSPNVGKTVEQKTIPAQRKIATATPPPTPRLLKTIPSGAASMMVIIQMNGAANL